MKRTLERIFTELEYGMRILSLKILRRYVIFFLRLMVRNGRKYGNIYIYMKRKIVDLMIKFCIMQFCKNDRSCIIK